MNDKHALTTAPIFSTIWRLSIPNMLAMAAGALVTIAETSYIGYLGTFPLAGIALVFPMVMLQQMISAGSMGGGISSAISRAIGAGDDDKANQLVMHAFAISVGLGILYSLLFLLWGRDIFALIGGSGMALDEAMAYANIMFLGAITIWLTNAFASAIRGSGNMKTPSTVLMLVAIGQVVLGGALGLGLGPFPQFGMAGVAAGQVIAYSVSAVYLGKYLRSSGSRVRLNFSLHFVPAYFKDILRVGAIASISSIQTVLTILILTKIVAGFGPSALAGYGIGTRLEFLLIPITFAIGVACVPMVGMAIGGGLVKRAKHVAWTGAALSAGIVGVIGLFAAALPEQWAQLFTDNVEVIAITHLYLMWVAPVYGFFALGLCLYFASQGAGKLLGPVLAGTLRLVMVAGGGFYMLQAGTSPSSLFALIACAMAAYGIVTAACVYWTRWEI
jgi:putative MATE family efflux protein